MTRCRPSGPRGVDQEIDLVPGGPVDQPQSFNVSRRVQELLGDRGGMILRDGRRARSIGLTEVPKQRLTGGLFYEVGLVEVVPLDVVKLFPPRLMFHYVLQGPAQ